VSVHALVCLLLAAAPSPSTSTPVLLRSPTVSKTRIAFAYGGDLWVVDRAGGDARRLTSDPGSESDPAFSADGEWIAFTGQYDGNEDVYVVSADGGIPKRLTSHPGSDQVAGWTRDGRVLFRSPRNSYSRFDRLFAVGVAGGLPEELPLPMAVEGSISPDGKRIAYVPFTNFRESLERLRGLKHYRGGLASPVWIATLADSTIEKLPRTDSNDSTPMWLGDQVYFLSDRGGPVALWVWDPKTKQVRQALPGDGQDVKSASAGPDAIVYEELGSIHLFEPASGKDHTVPIRVTGDFPAVRPHFEQVGGQIQGANVSPTGVRAVFEAHGEIVTIPADKGDVRNLTSSPAVADRDPAWSPDGKWIAWFSDESGEYRLMIRSQDGTGETKKIDLGPSSFYYSPLWSPDSKRIAYSDKRLNLWYVDVSGGAPVKIDTDAFDTGGQDFQPSWSSDGRWLAYTRQLVSGMHAVFVYSIEAKQTRQITDGLSDASSVSFDKNGRYLYFLASTDVGPTLASSMAAFKIPVTRAGYVVVLRKDLKSPLAPKSDEETVKGAKAAPDECNPDKSGADAANAAKGKDASKAKDAKKDALEAVKIDFDGIDQRVLALPVPSRNWAGMIAGKEHQLYLLEGSTVENLNDPRMIVHHFDVCTGKTEKVLDDVGALFLTADGDKALYEQLPPKDPDAAPAAASPGAPQGSWSIRPVASLGKPADPDKPGSLRTGEMEILVDPPAEWNQMFHESVRIERDFFYDPNMHGADLKALERAYQPYVDGLRSRADLTYVMADMFGEITAQHVYLGGGALPETRHVSGGLLGADWEIANGRYRVKKIYHGENWNPDLRAPLTEPGVDVHEGDYVLSVAGKELLGTDEVYAAFLETAGKTIALSVSTDPSGKGVRTTTVVPIADERALRLRAWMDDNRRKVDALSGGKVAYVYLPDTAAGGYTNFNRYYFAQSDRQAAVIDERFNGGGWIADYVVDWLSRPLLMRAMTREGRDQDIPQTIFGPKVMLINQHAGSGGDALPWMFRKLGIGPLVGTRTWGGLIGIGGYPTLLDGGFISAPRWGAYNPDTGEFDVENKGVKPDVEIDLDPAAWRAGKDPQLEKGVALVLEALKAHPPAAPKRPAYPVYDWKKVRAGAPK
jgi:tricorn protease